VARQLRMSVVGAGQMGTYHVENLSRMEQVDLVVVADPDEATARRAIAGRTIEWTSDWRAAVERSDLDAVIVAAPTDAHAEVTLAALEAGRHVLVEKPIAASVPEALRMASAARAAQRKLMVGHVERFNPAVAKVRELLASDRLGRVFKAHAIRVGPLPVRIRDAGVAIDLATHDLDLMRHVLDREVTRVYAEGSRFAHASQEDMLTCLLRFGDDGPFGVLDVNWITPEKRRELTILGEAGMVRASYLTQDVYFVEAATTLTSWDELARVRGDAEGSMVRFALRKVEPLRAELEAWVACVAEDTPEPVTAQDGVRALEAALAVRESASANRPVELLGSAVTSR
jgi:UDP-N-acetylglucosamine 3-dehydrogenase